MFWVRFPSEFWLRVILRRFSPDSRRYILLYAPFRFENNALGNHVIEEHSVV